MSEELVPVPSGDAVQLMFEGLPEATLLVGSSSVLPLLTRHFQRWPFAVRSVEAGPPYFHVEKTGHGFQISSSEGRVESYDTSAEMLCDLGIDLAESVIRHSPGMQCLHCSAVALSSGGGEKLVVFPNVNRAGKSLLAACFLPHRARLFADDLLAVTEESEGISFGLPPRLRLPLPPTAQRLADEMEALPGHGDSRYAFLYAGECIASFGEKRPIGAIVLPRRLSENRGRPPELRRLSPDSALQCMTYQFQMREGQAGAVLALARRLCERVPLWVLDYDSPEEAALLVAREKSLFSLPSEAEEAARLSVDFLTEEDRLSALRRVRGRSFPSDRNLHWLRAPDTRVYENGAFAYLIPKGESSIFGVDSFGLAVFALLAEPLSIAEAVGLLAEVFPQTGKVRLESDLSRFFRMLSEQGLIVRAHPPQRKKRRRNAGRNKENP